MPAKRKSRSRVKEGPKEETSPLEDGPPPVSKEALHTSNENPEAMKSSTEAKTRRSTVKQKKRSVSLWCITGIVAALVLLCACFANFLWSSGDVFPCHCCKAPGVIRSAVVSRVFGFTGLHLQDADYSAVEEQLKCLSACGKLVKLDTPFDGVGSFMQRLQNDAKSAMCVVWVVQDLAVIKGVDNSLKELLEDNTLRGDPILREGARGLFVLLSNMTREGLKELLPHRVVHQLSTVSLRAGEARR
uniref:Uncharacterized protein n=1 Tax=Trypanosoma congolense (strain IL3000) TaxID=1068625 RepID=G0USJ7_TRYCI|nr:conserved hypothetical protein [Trypanosoma congolense IL3000]